MANRTRWLKAVLMGLVPIVYAVPWTIYWYGLSIVEEFPQPNKSSLTAEDYQVEWRKFRGTGEPKLTPLTPWTYLLCYANAERCIANDREYGHIHADKLALAHVSLRNPQSGRIENANLKRIVLTIWITRNWQIEDVLATLQLDYGGTYTGDA